MFLGLIKIKEVKIVFVGGDVFFKFVDIVL